MNAKNGKPHAEESGRGDGRFACGCAKRHRACRTLGPSQSTTYYRLPFSPQKLDQEGLVEAVSRQWPCVGYEKVGPIVRYEHGKVVKL